MAQTSKFCGTGRLLITDKLTTVHASKVGKDAERGLTLDLFSGSCEAGVAYKTSVPGAYFLIGHELYIPPPELQPPMVLEFEGEQSDVVVAAYRHSAGISFFYGITVTELLEWKPPAKKEDFKEEALMISIKFDNGAIAKINALKNTATRIR